MEADAASRSQGRLLGEQLGLTLGGQRVDDLVQPLPFHDAFERIKGQVDAMVGHPPLREVIGANALRAVARPNLRTSLLRPFNVELLVARVEDARTEQSHRLRA